MLTRLFARRSEEAQKHHELLALMVNEPNIDPGSLAALTMPTLVVAGTHDMIAKAHTQLIADSIPGAQLSFLPGDHFVATKKPEMFNRTVLSFLDNIKATE